MGVDLSRQTCLDEARLSRSVRAWSLLGCLGWAGLLVLGSWYPFRYQERPWLEAVETWREMWRHGVVSRTDLAVNLVAGVPLGFFGMHLLLGLTQRASARAIAAALVLILCVVYSSGVEIAQYRFAARVPSLVDTAAQMSGAFVGVLVSVLLGRVLWRRAAMVFGREPSSGARLDAALDLYAIGYALWMLMPFIPAVSPSEVAARWRGGMIQLSPFHQWADSPWEAAYTAVVCVATAFPLGGWAVRRFRRLRETHGVATLAIAAGVSAAGLELVQVVIQTRTASAADAIWSGLGAIGGAVLESHLLGKGVGSDPPESVEAGGFVKPGPTRAMWWLVSLGYAVFYVLASWAPFDLVESKVELEQRLEAFLSFSSGGAMLGNDWGSATNLLRTALWSAVLGVFLGLAVNVRSKFSLICSSLLAAVGILLVCVLAEAGQVAFVSKSPGMVGLVCRVMFGSVAFALTASISGMLQGSPK
jgi:VanZ family protein